MLTGKELKQISKTRNKTIQILIDGEDWEMAVYTMALCLELSLKALICKRLNLVEYPEDHKRSKIKEFFKTHNFDDLVLVAGMNHIFSARDEKSIFSDWNNFHEGLPGGNWTDMRYMSDVKLSRDRVSSMYKSFIVILREIRKRW